MQRITVMLAVLPVVALLAAPASADQTTFTWTRGGGTDNWEDASNWFADPQPNPLRWPGEGAFVDDIVIVRWEFGMGDDVEVVKPNGDASITIAELRILYNQTFNKWASVTIAPRGGDQFHEIEVTARDGLTVEEDCVLTIGGSDANPNATLRLSGGGDIMLDGTILLNGADDGDQSALQFNPSPGNSDETYVTRGCGAIGAPEPGWITSGGDQVVLVLGPGNTIYGDVILALPLVNQGLVETYGGTLKLVCEPKIGPGDWSVTGGTMEVLAPVAGTGDLLVAGDLNLHRHFSLYGNLTQVGGSVITIDQDVMFDVGEFDATGCPADEE